MLKSTTITVILATLILLTACGEDSKAIDESNTASNPLAHDSANGDKEPQVQEVTETKQTDESNFKAELLISLKSYQDQMKDSNVTVLAALENNLVSLVEHEHTLYLAGFVNEKLADHMEYYYGEHFRYKFTDIESIEQNLPREKVHITVIGQRLDTTTGMVEDVKMFYAFQKNDQGEWMIHTID